jgi:Transglycosylase SLT domain
MTEISADNIQANTIKANTVAASQSGGGGGGGSIIIASMTEISVVNIQANTINANTVAASQFGGGGGGGSIIIASKIILGGYVIEAGDKGLYVTTPSGIRTKMELIDFRQTPIPETATLNLQPAQPSVAPAAAGTGNPGAGAGSGNFSGGGGYTGTPSQATAETPVRPVGDLNTNNSPSPINGNNPGVGPGYQPLSDNGKTTLANLRSPATPLDNDQTFLNGLDALAKKINVPADNLVTVFWIESRLWSGAINGSTQASGLNQIMPTTATSLGYTVQQIQHMSAGEQMTGPTTKYFEANQRLLPANPSMTDLYLLNFFPAAVGQPDDFICGYPQADGSGAGRSPSRDAVARNNSAFKGPEGYVTVGSVKNWMSRQFAS